MREQLSDPQVRTAWLMLAMVLTVFVVDGWLECRGQNATFSETAKALGRRWPAFPILSSLGAGLTLGHFFLGQN